MFCLATIILPKKEGLFLFFSYNYFTPSTSRPLMPKNIFYGGPVGMAAPAALPGFGGIPVALRAPSIPTKPVCL